MRAINTIPRDEYAHRLFEAMRRMSKTISRLAGEEDFLYMQAADNGDEEKALKHWFNSHALFWAGQAIVIAPHQLEKRIAEINRHEFTPIFNQTRNDEFKTL